MSYLQAIILGIIQGITEFLPVSSSGHLIFLPKIFGWADQGLSFDVVVHLGSLLAVIYFFRKKIWQILKNLLSKKDKQLLSLSYKLAFSVFPAGIAGLFFSDYIEATLRSPKVIALGLIGWGIVLMLVEKSNNKRKTHITDVNKTSWKKAIIISFAQMIALIPGTSRSGITMTAALGNGLSKTAAAEFSFLMSIPVIAIAGSVKMLELFSTGTAIDLGPLFVGFLSAAISGYFAISILMEIVKKWSFKPFVIYRVIVGILLLMMFV